MVSRFNLRSVIVAVLLVTLLTTPLFAQEAEPEPVGGIVKTIVGWAITLLGIGGGIAVVVRPSSRKEPKAKK